MSMLSKMLGLDVKAPVQTADYSGLLDRYKDPNAGMPQLMQQVQAMYQNALPGFQQQMQGQKEDNIRRGISTGDLGTSFEGDLTSAFQRNMTNAIAGQASTLYNQNQNRYSGLVMDRQDAAQSAQNNADERRSSLFGGLLKTGATIAAGGF